MKLALGAAAIGAVALLAGCAGSTNPEYPAQPVTYTTPAPVYVVPATPAPAYSAPATIVVPPAEVYPTTPTPMNGSSGGASGGASKHSEARVK
jgi:hypothetical protein